MKGKGLYIWNIRNCEDGVISDIVDKAVDCDFKHVLIKIADGPYGFNYIDGVDAAKQLADGLKAEGIDPIGWQYIYGVDPVGEAQTANRRMRETGCVGFVINAEQQYRDDPDNVTKAGIYNSHLDFDVPIALSTYRYPEVHPKFPYEKFLEVCDLVMPQVYWMEADNPVEQLAECIEQYEKITNLPILPTGSAFCEHGWCPSEQEIIDFSDYAQTIGLPGVNYWEWSNTKANGFMPIVRDYEWITEENTDTTNNCCGELASEIVNLYELMDKTVSLMEDYDDDIDSLTSLVNTCSLGIAELSNRLENLLQGQLELAENGLGYEDKFEVALDRIRELEGLPEWDAEIADLYRRSNTALSMFTDINLLIDRLESNLNSHSHIEPVGGTFWQRLNWLFTGKTTRS